MSSYRVKITALGTHKDVPALVKTLIRIPGISAERILQGLQHPPLELPPVAQESQAQQIKDTLVRLGAICIVEQIREAPVSIKEKDKETLVDGSHLLNVKTSHLNPSGTAITSPPAQHQSPVPQATQAPVRPRTSSKAPLFLFLGLAIAIASFFFSFQDTPKKQTQPGISTQQKAQRTPSETRSKRNPLKAGLEEKHTEAKQRQTRSEQLQARSRQTTDARTAARLLTQAVNSNPYNTTAWKELEEKLRQTGDNEGAKAARQSYEQALRVQNTLRSVAKAFGGDPKVEVSPATIHYQVATDMDDQEFYEAVTELYDTVSVEHPEKELAIENESRGHHQRLRIVPGRAFPDRIETY